jgi:hypothetical protein
MSGSADGNNSGVGRVEPVMRVYATVAALALALLSGCQQGSAGDHADGVSPTTGTPPAGTPSGGLPPGGTPSGGTASGGPGTSTPRPTPGSTPDRGSGPADDELPGPLPLPGRALIGTVERLGACTVLVTGQRRWGLMGPLAARLAVGDRVRVSGTPVSVPSTCRRVEVYQAIQVTQTQPA